LYGVVLSDNTAIATSCDVLRCVAMCCDVLRCVAVTKIILESQKISKQQYITMIVVLSVHTNIAISCEVLLWQYSFANFGKYDDPYMITVTKIILQSEKISKQQQ
jgi:hypothetical protein